MTTNNAAGGLLPCPFCGCSAKLWDTIETWVQCENCGTQTRCYNYGATAYEVWNTRTPSAPNAATGGEALQRPEIVSLMLNEIQFDGVDRLTDVSTRNLNSLKDYIVRLEQVLTPSAE